jgi:hypothetical protein
MLDRSPCFSCMICRINLVYVNFEEEDRVGIQNAAFWTITACWRKARKRLVRSLAAKDKYSKKQRENFISPEVHTLTHSRTRTRTHTHTHIFVCVCVCVCIEYSLLIYDHKIVEHAVIKLLSKQLCICRCHLFLPCMYIHGATLNPAHTKCNLCSNLPLVNVFERTHQL